MGRREKKRNSHRRPLTVVLAALFLVSAGMLVHSSLEDRREARTFEALRAQTGRRIESGPSGQERIVPPEEDGTPEDIPEVVPEPPPEKYVSPYAALYAQNRDLFGWLYIDGTELDYPVMYTPDDPEHYLHRGFDGGYAASGVPFLDAACGGDGGNYLVYGHNMKNGTMFAPLLGYAEKQFWEEHPVIHFDTMEEPGEYEVVAAFYARDYEAEAKDAFRYYAYTDLREEAVFTEYIAQAQEAACYDTGIDAAFGDQILTLSTCSYHTTNGRFVVVARKRR